MGLFKKNKDTTQVDIEYNSKNCDISGTRIFKGSTGTSYLFPFNAWYYFRQYDTNGHELSNNVILQMAKFYNWEKAEDFSSPFSDDGKYYTCALAYGVLYKLPMMVKIVGKCSVGDIVEAMAQYYNWEKVPNDEENKNS